MGTSYKRFMKRIHEEEQQEMLSVDIDKMDKLELDEYASNKEGIELDRRQSKKNMIKEFLTKLKGEK